MKHNQQQIVCAAIKHKKHIICGVRHYDRLMLATIQKICENSCYGLGDPVNLMTLERHKWYKAEQGFVDQFGQFLTRNEAFEVAKKADQIIQIFGGDKEILFSENLY